MIAASRNGHEAELPPHNLDAEQSVIGSILLDPALLDNIGQRLRPDDFHAAHCRRTYQELLAMRSAGVPIDGLILRNRLHADGAANVKASDLADIVDSVPTAANALHYADIVARRAEQRRLWYVAPRLKELASDYHRVISDYGAWRQDIDGILGSVSASGTTGDVDYGWLSFAEFMAQDVRQNYLVNGVVPEAQGGIVSGRFKTLKTSIALDLFVSMATGTAFLDRFTVPAPVPCALMTSESGAASIMAIAKRIAAAKGIDYRDGPHLTTLRAKMTDPRHLEVIERDIERHGWRCVGIDPTYLAFADVGEFCTNVYKMGAALEPVTALIQRTGCSLLLLNHSTKGRMKDVGRFDPPDLAEISMSGWAEWMRFWLLLSQVEEWEETTGTHSLWMRTGGSAGHAGLYQLSVIEGEHDDRGRRTEWNVSVCDVVKVADEKEKRKSAQKAAQQERKEQEHQRRLQDALKTCTEFESGRKLRELAGLSAKDFGTAIRSLLKVGAVEQSTIEKRGQTCDGYRLKDKAGQGGTRRDGRWDNPA